MRNLFPVSTDFAFPDSTFDNFFNGLFQPTAETQVKLPKVDIEDTGKAYVLTADLPGMAKKDITITYANDILTIGAQHKEETEEKSPETNAQAASASSDTAEKSSKAPAKEEHHSSVKNVPIRYTAVSSSSVTSSAMASKLRLKRCPHHHVTQTGS